MTDNRTLSTIERLELAADSGTGVTFVGASMATEAGPQRIGWNEIHDDARAVGAALQARGLVPGDHVAILGPTSRELITVIRGCWMAGLASMVLPLPMRMGSLDVFIDSTRGRILHGDAKLLLIDDLLADFYVAAEGDPPILPMKSVMPGAANVPSGEALQIPPHDSERLVILQYTSGSTSEPKGVMIPDRVLSANIDALSDAAEMGSDELLVSWLPLYHDMGLVGFLAMPMTKGVNLVQAAPQDFLAHPGNWMQWISDYRATATAGPNFSWVLATRALKRMKDLDLSNLTVALSGAEPVDPNAVDAFVAEAGRFGFTPGGMFPAFGMAEVAIAGTFPPRRRGLVTDTVDRIVLETQRVAKQIEIHDEDELGLTARQLPLLGKPVPGLEMKVVDPETFEELPERHVGELLLPRHVGDPRLLQAARCHRCAVPRRMALHGRPCLHPQRRTRSVRADQGRDHRRRSKRVPRRHRTRRWSTRRCTRRQRDRVRHGGLQGQGERGRRRGGACQRHLRWFRRDP